MEKEKRQKYILVIPFLETELSKILLKMETAYSFLADCKLQSWKRNMMQLNIQVTGGMAELQEDKYPGDI